MRRVYLVCYDISDPKRLRKMHKLMRGYGDPLQFSIFWCELTRQEKVLMLERVHRTFHAQQDRVMIVDLGAVQRKAGPRIEMLGLPPRSEVQDGAVVV